MSEVRTVIVGTRFRGLDAVAALAGLAKGDVIELRAEPDNPHDAFAVACHAGGVHLGYVPRSHNAQLTKALARGWINGARVALEAIVDRGEVVAAPKIVVEWGDDPVIREE